MAKRDRDKKVYNTTYREGVDWKAEQGRFAPLRAFLRKVGAFLQRVLYAVLGVIALAASGVASLFRRKTADEGQPRRPAAARRKTRAAQGAPPTQEEPPLGSEPVTLRTVRRRRSGVVPPLRQMHLRLAARLFACFAAAIVVVALVVAIVPLRALGGTYRVALVDEDHGLKASMRTNAKTVGELLTNYGMRLSEGDLVYPDATQTLAQGMVISVRRAINITTQVDGRQQGLRIQAGTVRDALAMAGVRYGKEDIVEPGLNTVITPGMAIAVTRVTHQDIVQTERLYFREITQKDSGMYLGESEVVQRGVEGEKETTVRVIYYDGQESERKLVGEDVLLEPMHRIVKEGAKPRPTATPVPTPKPATAAPGRSRAAQTTPAPTKITAKTRFSSNKYWVFDNEKKWQYEIKGTDAYSVTAYTHTGRNTATGTWPGFGTIAVDKSVVPLGTRLYVPGYGVGIARDTGVSGKHIDVFFETYEEAIRWGRKSLTVYTIGKAQDIK